ncbi:hypothetical protein [Streptomyces qinglanensis]|uniref:hypothetical protein n=1 Tax=Streptomyces qinglanensis TaxID=943816 RepID=UPI0009A09948|nr:hypothetical protein [Streptomyces qinglanensis]
MTTTRPARSQNAENSRGERGRGARESTVGRPGSAPGRRAFAAELRAALVHRGLPLERVCSRLAARGIRLSPATLSYWQHGRTVPERYNSLRAVAELEDILRLPGGTLGALLPPQRPRGGARDGTAVGRVARQPLFGAGSWQERALGTDLSRLNENLTVVSTREVLHLDDRGRLSQLSVSHLVRARENGARRMVNLHCLDNPGASRVHVDPVCGRTERLHLHPESGSVLIATRFGRDLLRGETALVEYRLRPEDGVLPAGRHEHGVNSPHRAYLLQVFFHPARVPAVCQTTFRPDADAEPKGLRRLRLDVPHSAHLHRNRCERGLHGLAWTWPKDLVAGRPAAA